MSRNLLKLSVLLLPFIFTAFTPVDKSSKFENYCDFDFLKEAGGPREIRVFKTGNVNKGKSLFETGILLTYKNRYAREVSVAGDFSNWVPADMTRGRHGVWYYFLAASGSNKTVRYKFMVDDIWINDPMNFEKEDDGSGSYVSILQPSGEIDTHNLTYRFIGRDLIEFRIYKPKAMFISLVGDFNKWNPENDLLERMENGIWALRKRLPPGAYRYKYIIDGDWTVDLYNQKTAWDEAGEICSLIMVRK